MSADHRADAIDDPLRSRENSNSESQEHGSSTGETPLPDDLLQSNCSGTSGPCESPNTVVESKVNDDQTEIPRDNFSMKSKKHENGGKNGQYETTSVHSNQNQTQSDKSQEKGEVHQETERRRSLPLTDTSRSYSEVTIGINSPPPPYNLRSRQNAPETTSVSLITILVYS